MSGDHAKKEMETGEKPTTSHGKTSLEESRNKRKEKKDGEERLLQREGEEIFFTQREEGEILFPQATSEWGQEKEDEESGLLRDRFFINIHLRLRRGVRHF
jgi:hypothetical protein